MKIKPGVVKSAVFTTIIFFGILHVLILTGKAIFYQSTSFLNIFSILDIGDFFPKDFNESLVGNALSLLIILLVFFTFLAFWRKRQ